jgi:hypothetical protein
MSINNKLKLYFGECVAIVNDFIYQTEGNKSKPNTTNTQLQNYTASILKYDT